MSALPTSWTVTESQVDRDRLAQWLDERCGCLTASRMKDAMDFLKNGNPSAKRNDYMIDLVTERLTQISVRHYVTPAMQHGIDTEPEAKLVYERLTGNKIMPAEFIPHGTIVHCGATPDGFIVNSDGEIIGLLEIKCPMTQTFVKWKMAGGIPEEHEPQLLLQQACVKHKTDHRLFTDFMAFDPRIKDEKMRVILRRYTPDPRQIDAIEGNAIKFLGEVDDMHMAFVGAA